MRKISKGLLLLIIATQLFITTPVSAQVTGTPTPTEVNLVTSPSVSPTATAEASVTVTPTAVTSLPKTGTINTALIIFAVSMGVILFSLVF